MPAGMVACLLLLLLLADGCSTGPSVRRTPGLSGPAPSSGWASWYGDELKGRPMANGRPFNPDQLTCASWYYPFGTRLWVSAGRRSVIVTVTDRGPAAELVRRGRIIDLSRAAFARLAPLSQGLVRVTVKVAR